MNKLRVVASKSLIVVSDGTNRFRKSSFSLRFESSMRFGNKSNLSAIFYDFNEDNILIHEKGTVMVVLTSKDKLESFYFRINDDILFHKTANDFIYFVMTDSTIGKFDIVEKKFELQSKVCSDGAKVVAFHAHEDETLLTVCTYSATNATTEIIVSSYASVTNYKRKFVLSYEIKYMVLTSKGQILASIYNISDNSYSLISLF